MKRALTVLWLAADLLVIRSPAGVFSFTYSPTGIAYDAVNNLVSVSSGGGVNTYDTNGSLRASFVTGSGTSDLGAGSGATVWVANTPNARLYDYYGNSQALSTIPPNTVALGRGLSIGGTNYLMYAVNGGSVSMQDGLGTTTVLMPTPANITGGDWILRPGGYALEHVLLALNTLTTVKFYTPDGTQFGSTINLESSYGAGYDVTFGDNEIWVAQGLNPVRGYAVPYPFTIPPVPEASVSVTVSNATLVVAWTGRALQTSANLTIWTPLTNAPQPCLLASTNAPQFFRALK